MNNFTESASVNTGYFGIMKKARLALIAAAIGILVAVPLQAGVHVTVAPEPVEKPVAFRTADNKCITTVTGGFLTLGGEKIGSKQMFTIIDLNGTAPADGDTVKIRYTPGGLAGDKTKSSYWRETAEGIKRGSEGSVFKIKLVDTKYAFQAPSGKFMTGVVTENVFGLSDKQADALLLELVDLSSGVPKAPKQPKAQAPAAPAPEKSATE
jgi:hypothetical protein